MHFIPDLALLLPFTVAGIILAITPGPDMTLFVGRALSEGTRSGIACMAGAMTGLLVHTVLVAAGLSALIVAAPTAFLLLKLAGALYLLWLAWQALRKGSAFSPDVAPRSPRPWLHNWLTGVSIDLLNPKVVLFFLTFLPQFVSASDPHAPGKLIFFGFWLVALSILICLPMVLAAGRFAAILRGNPRVTRAIDWLFAGIFSAFAVRILLTEGR